MPAMLKSYPLWTSEGGRGGGEGRGGSLGGRHLGLSSAESPHRHLYFLQPVSQSVSQSVSSKYRPGLSVQHRTHHVKPRLAGLRDKHVMWCWSKWRQVQRTKHIAEQKTSAKYIISIYAYWMRLMWSHWIRQT